MESSIMQLESRVKELGQQEKFLFNRFFEVIAYDGRMVVPDSFREKVVGYFKDSSKTQDEIIAGLETQRIVRTYNRFSNEGALFNALRASRPGMKQDQLSEIRKKVDLWIEDEYKKKGCDFCNVENYTPEDPFGRVVGKYSETAANVAKYDGWSSIVCFKKHNPLDFSEEELSDYVETGFSWFKQVSQKDESAAYPYLMWNCLPKAGASQPHGHAQVLMAVGRPYAKVSALMDVSQRYKKENGKDYFDDLFSAHNSVGLALQYGDSKVITSLTPLKEKETLVIAESRGLDDWDGRKNFRESVYRVLRCFIDDLGVHSFNLAVAMPGVQENGFPYVARIVDRGSIFNPVADMGGMELYGEPVIGSDPYKVMDKLQPRFSNTVQKLITSEVD